MVGTLDSLMVRNKTSSFIDLKYNKLNWQHINTIVSERERFLEY